MRLLFIDRSNSSEIKILNTNLKKSLQIISAYFIPISEGIDPVKAIAKKLKEENLIKIPVVIIPPRSIMNYQTFTFPVIPEKEIRKILPREIQKYTGSTEDIIFDFRIGSSIIEKNEKKIEVIAYYIKKNEIWNMLEALKEKGVHIVRLIPEVRSIEAFIKESFLTSSKGIINGIVVIEMMSDKINMNIFNKNFWSLNREFPFKVGDSDSIGDKDFSRISTEFSRTFQYFKQKNKNVSIDEAIIYGSNHEVSVLTDFINDNQPLNATIISSIKTDCEIIFPKKLKDKDEFISMFFIAISTANSVIRKDFIDLYPVEFTEKEKFPRQVLIFSLIGLAVFITLAVLTTFSLKQKNQYKSDLKKIETEFNMLQTQIDRILEVRKKRKDYYEKIIIMKTPQKHSYKIAEFIRELSLTISQDLPVEIIKLDIIPKDERIVFSLEGKLYSDSINGSLTAFDVFLKKIKALGGIKINNFTPPSSSTVLKDNNILSWSFSIKGYRDLVE